LPEIDRRRMIERAREFAVGLDWSIVAPRWVPVVDRAVASRREQRTRASESTR
jgi:hypothetical protein